MQPPTFDRVADVFDRLAELTLAMADRRSCFPRGFVSDAFVVQSRIVRDDALPPEHRPININASCRYATGSSTVSYSLVALQSQSRSSNMTSATAEHFAAIVSLRVEAERHRLAGLWLGRLNELLTVDVNDVFPSERLLDHIPTLIGEIAAYLRAPADEEIAANTVVIEKARELGSLRHEQRASVHQLLREYEILAEILEMFVVEETERLGLQPSAAECFELLRRLTHSSRTLMRTTVDTFVSEYMTAIEDRNERIRTFNQMASHELRSPIGTLLFAAAALERADIRDSPAKSQKITTTIKNNAERLSWLVENLQRVTRLSGALDAPNEQNVEVGTIANEVARQLEEMASSRHVHIVVGAALPELCADPARLELALMNLVSNAIKYSDPAKNDSFVEITSTVGSGGAQDTCVIQVRDNGLGIPEANRAAIFDRFFRAHAHMDGELGVSGSGLGLAIAADCVQAMDGSIECASSVGEGSCFSITLPLRPPHGRRNLRSPE
jgi:signal transduction histidine kinase